MLWWRQAPSLSQDVEFPAHPTLILEKSNEKGERTGLDQGHLVNHPTVNIIFFSTVSILTVSFSKEKPLLGILKLP